MDKKKALPLATTLIAFIIGVALYKQFDVQTFRFQQPALAVVYMIAIGICIALIVRKRQSE